MNEKELVLLSKGGNKEAFSELYSLYKDKLYRYAFYRLENRQDAEDAVSDAVYSAFYQIGRLKKPEAFSAWIFRILYVSCGEIIKARAKRRAMADINDMSEKLTYDMEETVNKTELQQALDILKDDEREIVLLSVVSGLNSKEISKICDMTPGSVRSKLSRSLAKMREFLEG